MKKIVFALSALMLSMSMLVGCSGSNDGNIPGNPVEISDETVIGIWKQFAVSYNGEYAEYPDDYAGYFEFRADGRLLTWDPDGEFRGINNWSLSEGVISITDATDINKNAYQGTTFRDVDAQDWRIDKLTDMALKIQVKEDGSEVGIEDIYMTFKRPISLPNFFGKPADL